MKVTLVSYSQPPPGQPPLTLTELVAFCARVSNPSHQNVHATDDRLIRYLVSHQHWSPLEMVHVCLEIETTRDIARQLLRHRSFSFQEFSQRYAVADLGFDLREARLQDTQNRQNSLVTDDAALQDSWSEKQEAVVQAAHEAYAWALENGIAKEQARAVLPEGNTRSRLYMNGTLRSWVHYVLLRTEAGTQREHQAVACACADVLVTLFPVLSTLLTKDGV
jgi:thymidylate synthase (FAD)